VLTMLMVSLSRTLARKGLALCMLAVGVFFFFFSRMLDASLFVGAEGFTKGVTNGRRLGFS
jgi:hypothetical protein